MILLRCLLDEGVYFGAAFIKIAVLTALKKQNTLHITKNSGRRASFLIQNITARNALI